MKFLSLIAMCVAFLAPIKVNAASIEITTSGAHQMKVPIIVMLMNNHAQAGTEKKLSDIVDVRSIPMGCFAALDESDDAYRECRRPSMRANLVNASRIFWDDNNRPYCYMEDKTGKMNVYNGYPKSACDVEKQLNWELTALHELIESMKISN